MSDLLELQHECVPHPNRQPGFSAYDLVKVGFFLFGFPKNGFGSIDVTKACNLRCRHCYFFEQDEAYGDDDLTIEAWEKKLLALKSESPPWEFPFLQCTWVGGEPLVRKKLIDRCRHYETINEDLWMDFPERDRMPDMLTALKQVYRAFIVLPERAFERMKSENCKAVTDNCLFSKKSFAFGPQGEKKEKCMMGPKADCDRCCCVVPFYMASLVDRRRIVRDNGRDLARWVARKVDTVAAWIS